MAKEIEQSILMTSVKHGLIELIGDYLDSESVQTDMILAQVKDPQKREDTDLHIKMAKAALDVLKKQL